MSKSEHSKNIPKIAYSHKVYHSKKKEWYHLQLLDIGDIKYSIQADDHYGWLKCDGRSVSRVDYPHLFEVIGTSFGSNDADTFKLPDSRGRVLGAIGAGSGLSVRTLGQTIGSETHILSVNEMPSHTHSITDPGHTHNYVNNVNNQGVDNAFNTESAADNADLGATTSSSTTGITVNATGGGQAHNNMQPTTFIGNVFVFANYNKSKR